MPQEKYCLGCELANKKLPVYVVYEDEYVTCILDHAPFNDGHTLILPKRNILKKWKNSMWIQQMQL